MTDASWSNAAAREAEFGDYIELLKPGVMRLVVFTAFVGLACAPVPVHPVIALAAVICIAVGAGAAGALNMWWDSDIDAAMARTAGRPIPTGRVGADEALAIGVTLAGFAVVMLALFLAVGLVARNSFELALGLLLWMLAACGALVVCLWMLARVDRT